MSPFILFNLLIGISTVVWSIIAAVYIYPWLREKPWHEAVLPLLLLHAFRFVPMTAFGPGQMAELPPAAQSVADGMAWGDLVSAVAAIGAALLLLNPQTRTRWAVWGFFAIGLGDNVVAFARAAHANLFQYELGFSAQITVIYVPILLISYVLIVLLMRRAQVA